MKEVENDFIKFWIEDNILYSQFKKPTDGTIENIKAIIDLRTKISDNKKQYWCYDFNGIKSYDKDARDYAEKNGQEHLAACAAVLNSHISKFILNAFMTLKKPIVPLKGFTKKNEAVNWLNELKKKNEQI
ncbi:DUF7793 family protein [Flavobacterium sp. CF136]|jgi:hypothetical protein|uniref:DUF7793 family protein n=1 Tax=Flavobacterium sp. (strain CF136) TaxID=1144313 RepID=UPI000271D2B4|nr:hypothetical protein [Flavobacterium sp. CF136]EJL59496.1 hypothetical protein PMI10_04122 [Flavobacterium sp. CF136]